MAQRFECERCEAVSDFPLIVERASGICIRCQDIENDAQPVFYSED